jgi:Ser/Thr protein kinase RdoA (MazF antagonist)
VDGRLLALNSYENRVYQVGLDDAEPVIVKFYRAGRWSDAQILEEHAFAQALADARGAGGAAAGHRDGATLHRHLAFASRSARAAAAARRSWTTRRCCAGSGRLLARLHNIGATPALRARPTLDIESFGDEPGAYLLLEGWMPKELEPAYRSVVDQALDEVRACFERAGDVASSGCTATATAATCSGPTPARTSSTSTTPAPAPPSRTCGCCSPATRRDGRMQLGAVLAGYREFRDFDPRELHLLEALRTLRQIHYAAWLARRWQDPAFPAAFPWFEGASASGRIRCSPCASRSRPCRRARCPWAEGGGAADAEGVVEFIARYKSNGRAGRLHEVGRFRRVGAGWCYLDGMPGRADSERPVQDARPFAARLTPSPSVEPCHDSKDRSWAHSQPC